MDFKFDFNRRQISKIPRERIIEELAKVAKHFNYTDFSQSDFTSLASISYFTVNREYGGPLCQHSKSTELRLSFSSFPK